MPNGHGGMDSGTDPALHPERQRAQIFAQQQVCFTGSNQWQAGGGCAGLPCQRPPWRPFPGPFPKHTSFSHTAFPAAMLVPITPSLICPDSHLHAVIFPAWPVMGLGVCNSGGNRRRMWGVAHRPSLQGTLCCFPQASRGPFDGITHLAASPQPMLGFFMLHCNFLVK